MEHSETREALDARAFFDGKPAAYALFCAFDAALRKAVPTAAVNRSKTQLSYDNGAMFACVSFLPVKRGGARGLLTVTFGLARREQSPRIAAAVEPYPGRFTHHVPLFAEDEIDAELLRWLSEAAAFAAAKRKQATARAR